MTTSTSQSTAQDLTIIEPDAPPPKVAPERMWRWIGPLGLLDLLKRFFGSKLQIEITEIATIQLAEGECVAELDVSLEDGDVIDYLDPTPCIQV